MSTGQYNDVTSWLRSEEAGALTVETPRKSTLAMAVIRYGQPFSAEPDNVLVPEEVHTFGWNLRGAAGVACISRDPKVKSAANDGETTFCALPELVSLRLSKPCVAQHFVSTRAFLDKLADGLEAPPISHVGRPELAIDDPILATYGSRLLQYVGSSEELDVVSADYVMTSMAVGVCGHYGGLVTKRPLIGGLTRWQMRLAQDMIDANQVSGVPWKTLAEACRPRTRQFVQAVGGGCAASLVDQPSAWPSADAAARHEASTGGGCARLRVCRPKPFHTRVSPSRRFGAQYVARGRLTRGKIRRPTMFSRRCCRSC